MSYYRRYSRPETIPATAELAERIDRMASELKTHLTDWEQGFIESIADAYKKYNGLTTGQFGTFEKIEKKYDPEALAEKASWAKTFDAKKRETLKYIADYYRPTGYFSGLVAKIDSDPTFVPNESTWKKFVENKYAKKVLAAASTDSKFVVGGFALLRDTFRPRGPGFWGSASVVGQQHLARRGRTLLVLKHSARKSTDKVFWVAYIDNPTVMWEIEERWLKKHRTPKKRG
jgi:hypothetical protein